VDDRQILDIVHQTAAEMMAGKDGEIAGHFAAASADGGDVDSADSFIDRYGFSSIDALEYLLILEKRFQITLADEELDEEVLFSAAKLASRIASLQRQHA
jgi:acyl carrier protein